MYNVCVTQREAHRKKVVVVVAVVGVGVGGGGGGGGVGVLHSQLVWVVLRT